MSNFEFYTPTHVYFGRDTQRQVGDLVRAQGCKKVLVHFGGLFLGYPIDDVVAFIANKGRNCLCCGCWKCYTDAEAAQKAFCRFRKCTSVYKRLFACGRTLDQLVVAA